MEPRTLLDILTVTERLKHTTRHCYTSAGHPETVAAHSWMAALMAFFLRDEFPDADMDKVIKMCLIHDLGECFTGDIPTFDKNQNHENLESKMLNEWVSSLPARYAAEMCSLYAEMSAMESQEAKIYKAIDNLEAVIQHNLSDISTWIPLEYQLNLTYGDDKVAFSDYMRRLREEIRIDTVNKIKSEG